MKCLICERPLLRAYALLAGHPIGPTCARKHGFTAAGPKIQRVPQPRKAKRPERDQSTLDLFDGLDGAISQPHGSIDDTMKGSGRGVEPVN